MGVASGRSPAHALRLRGLSGFWGVAALVTSALFDYEDGILAGVRIALTLVGAHMAAAPIDVLPHESACDYSRWRSR